MPNENEQSNGFASRFYLTTPVEGGTSVVERYDIEALRLVDSESRNPANVGDSTHPVYFLNGEPKECAGGTGGGGGSDVKIFPKYKGGTLIANYTIDGANGRLYSPSVAEIYKKVTLWPPTNSSGSYMSEVGDNNEDNPFKTMISNYEFLLIHYAPTNSLSEERTMMLDAQSLKNSLPNNAVFSCHYLSDVFIKCKFTSQDKFEVVESEGIPLSDEQDPQLLKCAIKKIEGLQFGASGADLDQGLTIKEVLWSGVADEVDYTQKFKTDTIESFNYIYLHFYATNNKYEERILVIDQEAIIEGLTKDPSEAYFTCDISDDLYIKGKFVAIDEFTITEVQTKTIDGVVVKPVLNQIDGICMGSVGGSGGGDTSDCMKKGIDYVTAGQDTDYNIGERATAEGENNKALGDWSHVEGYYNIANGDCAHAEGRDTRADELCHVEGYMCIADNGEGSGWDYKPAHAEGYHTSACGTGAHAEGISCVAGRSYAEGGHAEGFGCTSINSGHSEGSHSFSDDAHAEGYSCCAISGGYGGGTPHAEGIRCYASGYVAHAEGWECTAINDNGAHASGSGCYSIGRGAHAMGFGCTTFNDGGTALGVSTCVGDEDYLYDAYGGLAEGYKTLSLAPATHAGGFGNNANNHSSFTCGHWGGYMTTGGDKTNQTGTAFIIGNGTSSPYEVDIHRSNAFSVQYDGTVSAAGNLTAANVADYAENFEWVDGNLQEEDRVGLFVTFDENNTNKIRIANSSDDYILGIISGAPFVLGNGDCDVWNGMVLRDNFNRIIYEDTPLYKRNYETGEEEPVLDEEGNQIYQGKKPVYNPEYDDSQQYIPRKERAEWDAVGMLGVLAVRDDGTCIPGKYCKVAEGGIATYQATYNRNENCYRVTERVAENVVKIVFK